MRELLCVRLCLGGRRTPTAGRPTDGDGDGDREESMRAAAVGGKSSHRSRFASCRLCGRLSTVLFLIYQVLVERSY